VVNDISAFECTFDCPSITDVTLDEPKGRISSMLSQVCQPAPGQVVEYDDFRVAISQQAVHKMTAQKPGSARNYDLPIHESSITNAAGEPRYPTVEISLLCNA
jgi:hypothetical protein